MATLEEILLRLNKAGVGDKPAKKVPAPKKAPAPAPVPAPAAKKAPAPAPKKAPAPAPAPKKAARFNLRPGEPSNIEKYGSPLPLTVVKAIQKAGIDAGWIRISPKGEIIHMPDYDPDGRKSGLAYRA